MSTWLIIIVTVIATFIIDSIIRQFITREKKVEHRIDHIYNVTDSQFQRTMGDLFYSPFSEGNKVVPLVNGEQIFPAMLQAIRNAERTINFETFIYWSGDIGREFAERLSERARAGVHVHVLLDWLGSKKIDSEYLTMMQAAGVRLSRYHKIHWYHIRRLNYRTHRKLLIIDGKVGFTGGVGIADEWQGCAQDERHWRDTHFYLEGPAVAQLQAAFMDNWLKTGDAVLHGEAYFPPLARSGDALAQVFQSSPAEGSQSIRLMYLMSITASCQSIRISTAYFVPDNLAINTLIDARKRGVRIEIIMPGEYTDQPLARLISRKRMKQLLEAGIEIYEFLPTMYHVKVMVVDQLWVSVGSTNFDNRSFRLNDEANLNVIDAELAEDQIACFERDKARAKRITLEDWHQRTLAERLKAHAAYVLRTQL
jgi:cardiolipin synthase